MLSEDDKKEGILKGLKNIKDKNEELINTLNTTNKAAQNKTNIQSKIIHDGITVLPSLKILTILKNYHLILCLT